MSTEQDAKRWRLARQFLSVEDIERWPRMLDGGHIPSERDNKYADEACDEAMAKIAALPEE